MARQEDRHGVLMHGLGRWLVYSRPRAWLGATVEIPRLLRGLSIPRAAICLDIATGIGWASWGLLRREASARIVALDYDGTILPQTRAYLRSHGAATSVVACRADAKLLPFQQDKFDLALCMYGLHHFRGYAAALREIARVLKVGGTFAMIDPIRSPGKSSTNHHGLEVVTGEELQSLLGDAGFAVLRSQVSLGRVQVVARKDTRR